MCTKQKSTMGNDIAEKKREMCTEKRAFNNIQKSAFQYKNLYPLNGEKIEKKNIFFTARHKNECNWQKQRRRQHEHIIKIRFIYPLTIVISSTSEMNWI